MSITYGISILGIDDGRPRGFLFASRITSLPHLVNGPSLGLPRFLVTKYSLIHTGYNSGSVRLAQVAIPLDHLQGFVSQRFGNFRKRSPGHGEIASGGLNHENGNPRFRPV